MAGTTFGSSAELLSLPVLLDPYPFYRWLRSREPVHWSEGLGTWMITSHREALAVLRDPRASSRIDIVSDQALDERAREELRPLFDLQRQWMQQSDPPEHTRIRNPWVKIFGSAAAERIEAELTEQARALVTRGAREGELDVIEVFTPLPAHALARVLGLSPDDMARFRPWIEDYLAFRHAPSPETGQRALASVEAWKEDVLRLLHRPRPPDDPLVELCEQQGPDQLFATITSLMSGRYEPTVGLIGNGILALLEHPDQHPACLATGSSIDDVVDEMLRYDCPFQSAVRLAREPMRSGERDIPRGAQILVLLGAANRDPDRFDRPDDFLVGRGDQGYLSFGFGTHYCLGLSIARAMARSAIAALLELLPRLRLGSRYPDWQFDVIGYRALRSLRLEID